MSRTAAPNAGPQKRVLTGLIRLFKLIGSAISADDAPQPGVLPDSNRYSAALSYICHDAHMPVYLLVASLEISP